MLGKTMSPLAFAALVTLLSVATTGGAARNDPGEYSVAVMKDEPMVEALSGLVRGLNSRTKEGHILPLHDHSHSHHHHGMTKDCLTETSGDQEKFPSDLEPKAKTSTYSDDFEPRPSATDYRGKGYSSDNVKLTEELKKKVTDDFEPRPSFTDYRGKGYSNDNAKLNREVKKKLTGDSEPRPSITDYRGKGYSIDIVKLNQEVKKKLTDEFEPRPSATDYRGKGYNNDRVKLNQEVKKMLTDDFEPRPSATDYRGKGKEKKSYPGDFELSPKIYLYQG
ncbi:organ-specific protein S2-like [Punica granatum]|uniref:Organ-specific protein S2-like n=1 Tax=Punica granatum TaxID=22663 RepID=A0A6P8DEB5_PUNGR|nr:organ-specific protein S2-like [Punica granatum]